MMDPDQGKAYVDAVYDEPQEEKQPAAPRRVQFLAQGATLTAGDRNEEYGEPYFNLTAVAQLFSAYLYGKYGGALIDERSFGLTAEDIAWFNTLQKMARTFNGVVKPDTYIDAAVYAAIAGECAEVEASE